MLATELLDQIGQKPLPSVLLLCPGKASFNKEPWEPMLAERCVDKLVAEYVDPDMADMVYSSFHADDSQPGAIVQEAETLPFLAERRVIVVRNVERYNRMSGEKGSPLAALMRYLDTPCDTTLLILVSAQIDKRKKLYKACKKLDAIVECPQLEDNALRSWVQEELGKREKRIRASAINELIGRAGSKLSDVQNALDLVATYVGDAEEITDEDVNAACADVAEESVWTLTDAIAASDTPRALATLHQLADMGKAPDELMGLINWLLESAYKASPETQVNLQSNFVARKVMPLANKLGLKKLKAACALCTKTHFMLRTTGVDQFLALELLVIKLSAPIRRRSKARS